MQTMLEIMKSAEFWVGVSLVAAALPGPQTRFLPEIFRAIARALAQYRDRQSKKIG